MITKSDLKVGAKFYNIKTNSVVIISLVHFSSNRIRFVNEELRREDWYTLQECIDNFREFNEGIFNNDKRIFC